MPILNQFNILAISIFSKVSIYRQSICHIDISNRATQTNDLPTKDPGNPPSLPIQGPLIAFSWLDSWLGKGQPWARANAHLLKRLQKTQRSSKWTALSLSGTIVQPVMSQPTTSEPLKWESSPKSSRHSGSALGPIMKIKSSKCREVVIWWWPTKLATYQIPTYRRKWKWMS